MDLSDVNYSEKDLNGALCLEFTSKQEIGGSYTDKVLRSILFNLRPCTIVTPSDCKAIRYNSDGSILDPNVDAVGNQGAVRDFLQEFTMDFGHIEDSPGLKDFDKPLIRNLVFKTMIKVNNKYATPYKYFMARSIVETESGWFNKQVTSIEGLKLETTNTK